jgi:hypothetical protein
MAHQLRFVVPRPGLVGWELGYSGPSGQLHARGVASEAKIRMLVQRLMRRHGPRRIAAVMGCDCNHRAINREIRDVASERAFQNLSGMLGISPLKLLKTAAQYSPLNPFNPLSPQMLALRALKTAGKGASSLFRRRSGGGSQQQQQDSQDSQNPDDSQSQDDSQDSQNPDNQQEDTTMGTFEIGRHHRRHHLHGIDYDIGCHLDGLDEVTRTAITFAPGGSQALQAIRLVNLAKSNNRRIANAASVLNKAKRGDPSAIKKIGFLKGRAKQGDPAAKDAVKRLQRVDRVTSVTAPTGGNKMVDLYRAGIQG